MRSKYGSKEGYVGTLNMLNIKFVTLFSAENLKKEIGPESPWPILCLNHSVVSFRLSELLYVPSSQPHTMIAKSPTLFDLISNTKQNAYPQEFQLPKNLLQIPMH